jgi:hypothetical protein
MPAKDQPRYGQEDITERHSFDELAKGLASATISRRRVLTLAGAALLGGVLTPLFPGVAEARKKHKRGGSGGGFPVPPLHCKKSECKFGRARCCFPSNEDLPAVLADNCLSKVWIPGCREFGASIRCSPTVPCPQPKLPDLTFCCRQFIVHLPNGHTIRSSSCVPPSLCPSGKCDAVTRMCLPPSPPSPPPIP